MTPVHMATHFHMTTDEPRYDVTLTSTALTHLPPGQNYRHSADDIFRGIFVNEKFCDLIKISMKFVPKGPIDNIPALV